MTENQFGKLSSYSALAFLIFILIFEIFVKLGERGGDTFFSNPILTIPILLAALAGGSALLNGLISTIKHKELSIIVIISTLVGGFVTWFTVAEILYPH